MNIPVFINNQGIETYIKPWHRPDLVDWEPLQLPDWAPSYVPTSMHVECCCGASGGFSGAYVSGNVPAVPELSTSVLVMAGVLLILLFKWRHK